MIYRCILPKWAHEETPSLRRVVEGEFSEDRLHELNSQGYNIYFLPNHPSHYDETKTVDGGDIDSFNFVFCDMDLKDGVYATKQAFSDKIIEIGIKPTFTVDSGNGVHVYWSVSDLDAMSFLKLQRRLMRLFNTDEAVGQIYQLMRTPGTLNTKDKNNLKPCEITQESDAEYTCEQLDRLLPKITKEDEEYCKQHYDKTYNISRQTEVDDTLPPKFGKLISENEEIRQIWLGDTDDRSKSDFRLGHIMLASGFTKKEAMSVLVNSEKAKDRAPKHRISYAENIVDKIWTFEVPTDKPGSLSRSVKDILQASEQTIKGTPFRCHKWIDDTEHGFRLGQVIGLVAGSGVGKTEVALNMFKWFVERNPNYDHFFIPLEQPANEIADRWRKICGQDTTLHEKVHIISNYNDDGSFRHLSFVEIKDYILQFQKDSGRKIGCVVMDHIGALKKKGKNGENQDLMDICHSMKSFAIETNTLLVMQSQAPREKAGIGDLELNKDAAYGTVYFESYCDYLMTLWQPLKRCYGTKGCPTVTAFKFCKIRHKNQTKDRIQEDVPYRLFFDPDTSTFRELSETEQKSFRYFNNSAVNKRKGDKRTQIIEYQDVGSKEVISGEANHNKDSEGARSIKGVH